MHYNRANVCRYKEDYSKAVECYKKANALDPSLPAQDAIEIIVRWVSRVSDLISRKGRVKLKKLDSLVTTLPPTSKNIIQGRKRIPISSLNRGSNEGKVVALKLLVDVVRSNEPPGCFVMIDEEYSCIAVSIYHLDSEVSSKLNDKDVFYLLDPFLKVIDLALPEGKGNPAVYQIRYNCLQVAEPHLFLVNGKVMLESYAHAQVKLDNFDL